MCVWSEGSTEFRGKGERGGGLVLGPRSTLPFLKFYTMRRYSRGSTRVLERMGAPSAYALQQRRELWPMIVGGMAVFAAGTVLNYGYRALKAMDSQKDVTGDDTTASDESVADAEGSHQAAPAKPTKRRSVDHSIGFDIGSANARVSLRTVEGLSVLINSEGKRQTPVELLVGSMTGDVVSGHVAKMQRWAKPSLVSSTAHLAVGMGLQDFLAHASRATLNYPPLLSEDPLSSLEFALGGLPVSPADAYHRIAMNLCDSCSPAVNTLRHPCVVAVPTYFSTAQSAGAVKALRRTGVSDVEAISDAQCAAAGAAERSLWKNPLLPPDVAIVVDVGGHFTQISLVEMQADKQPVLVESTTLYGVGGEAIDTLMVDNIAGSFKTSHGINLTSDPMAVQRLYDAIESSKLELSNKLTSRVNIPFISASAAGPLHLDETYSRAAYESVISPVVSQLSPAVAKFVEGAIDRYVSSQGEIEKCLGLACVMAGGGARIPCVQREVTAAMLKASRAGAVASALGDGSIDVVMPDEPEELVVVGAAAFSKLSDR